MSEDDPTVETMLSIESPAPVEPVPVRLVDLEPTPDPAGTESPEPVATAANTDPPDGTAPASESTVETAAPQVSEWSIAAPAGERVAFSFNLAKLVDQGEDSDPILHEARDLGLVAVFDGMGGAGGTTYPTAEGTRTGAYIASRAARDIVDRRMLDCLSTGEDLDRSLVAAELHDSIDGALRARLAELQTSRSILRSKLLRALPTTMALAAVKRDKTIEGRWDCHLLWAGDSRVYLLSPGFGAAQLTTDDIRDQGDALANLRQDSVISNAMSADTAFVVNHRKVGLNTPFLIIAATDGCYGFVPSPMHFEWLLLSTLREASDPKSWSGLLQAQIAAVTGDDASMAVLGIGTDHQGFQSLFADRTSTLQTQWVSPLDQLDAEVTELERRATDLRRRQAQQTAELWGAYRPDYERYMTIPSPGKDVS